MKTRGDQAGIDVRRDMGAVLHAILTNQSGAFQDRWDTKYPHFLNIRRPCLHLFFKWLYLRLS